MGQSDVIEKIYDRAFLDKDDPKTCLYSIPYFNDIAGICDIGHCLLSENVKTINVILKYLSAQGIDHHSRCIYKFLPDLIDYRLGNIYPYMESRVK